MMLPEPPRCAFPGCGEWADHEHHITYNPEVKKHLCFAHHEEITILNGQQARKYRTPLSNKFRWWIWYAWTRGELKVRRRTRKALEWTEDWAGRPVEQPKRRRAPRQVIVFACTEPVAQAHPEMPKARRQRKKAKARKTVKAGTTAKLGRAKRSGKGRKRRRY